MYFLTEYDGLLKTLNDIWNKISNSINKDFGSEPIHNKIFLKTKIKPYGERTTDFHDKEIRDEEYYAQVFLKECKFTEKEKRWLNILLMT